MHRGKLFHSGIICVLFFSFGSISTTNIQKPTCNKHDTFFKHGAIYTYDYTITTSNGFIGVSESKSGSKLSCTVTLSVPRKCEIIMELSECVLTERVVGPDVSYRNVENTESFIQDLQRYSMYFQTNEGLVEPDSIVAYDDETLPVLNIKRGIVSALQFQILESDQYTDDVEETDIFGLCHTKYTFSEREPNTIHTFRNLRQCEMPQVFLKQFNSPFAAVKPLLGGVQDGTISEFIYPFVSEVSCDYRLNAQKRLANAACHQTQYFLPTAYKGDVLASVMTNISQSLELIKYQRQKQPSPDMSLNGRSVIDIRYTYSADLHLESSATQIVDSATNLATLFDHADRSDDYSVLPGLFEELVVLVRRATEPVLREAVTDIFQCGEGCDETSETTRGGIFLEALKVCGSEACSLCFIRCLDMGHVSTFSANHFLSSLARLDDIPESVLSKLYAYCKKTESTLCWLSLGTFFSHNYVEDEQEDSVLFAVQDEMSVKVTTNCRSETLMNTERELNTAIKTLANIGVKQNMRYLQKRPDLDIASELQSCLTNKAIPSSVKRSVLRSFRLVQEFREYKDTPESTVETLFRVLKDTSEDMSVRTQAFSQLIKTTVKDDIIRLRSYVLQSHSKQMKAYMTTALRSLLENDAPEMAEIKESWKAVKKEKYFNLSPYYRTAYSPTLSKSLNIGNFFKIPISDIFGGQLILDLVYSPSSSVFTTLSVEFNYYYSNQKHNLFELSLNLHGFQLLLDVFLDRVDMSPQDLMNYYNYLKARAAGEKPAEDEIHFAKFQQNLIKAVEDILQEVDHPVELDFDFSVDVVFQGQELMFMSLREVIEYVREMKAKLPPNKSVSQMFLQKLMAGVFLHPYRFTEMVRIDRGIPTCAGLPLNMTVSLTGKGSIPTRMKSNLGMYMADKINQLSVSLTQYMNFAYDLTGTMTVPFGDVHSSGSSSHLHVLFERGASVNVRYGYSDPMVQVENPTKRKLEFELYPILQDKESEDLVFARHRMYLINNGHEEVLPSDPNVQTTVERCTSNEFNMLLGRSFCLYLDYPNVTTSRHHAYFPLSGPFDLSVKLSKVDSVQCFTTSFEYFMEKEEGKDYTYNLNFEHFGKGNHLSRHIFQYMAFDPSDQKLTIKAGFPEAKIAYEGEYDRFSDGVYGSVLQEWIKFNDHVVSGYILKYYSKYSDVHERFLRLNYTDPTIGWEWLITSKGKAYDLTYTYFCTMDRPLLYLFHPIPLLASENGDKTTVTYHYENKDSDVKRKVVALGIYDKKVTADITVTSDDPMITDYHGEIAYFDGENERKYIFGNKLSQGMSQTGMTLTFETDISSDDVTLNGKISGSLSGADITITGDVHYTNNEEENISRKKRSLKSIYGKFKQIRKSWKNRIQEFENKLFSKDAIKPFIGEASPDSSKDVLLPEGLLENIHVPPSIWDLKQWNAKIDLEAKLLPVFPSGVMPGTAPPEGYEVHGTATAKHPWNGGYVEYKEVFKMGSRKDNTRYSFKAWFQGDLNSTVTDLNGDVIIVDGKPAVTSKHGGFFVDRQWGKIFNYSMNYHSPDMDKVYSILFNWDAPNHHEPLIRVFSELTWKSVPFFNHRFEEIYTYEKEHVVHTLIFKHSVLNVSAETEFDFRGPKREVHQNGTIALKVSNWEGSTKFKTLINENGVTCDLVYGSLPDKTLGYKLQIEDTYFVVSSSMKPAPDADAVSLTSTKVELWGNSHFMVTTSWSEFYHKVMEGSIRAGLVTSAETLSRMADNIRNNQNRPILLWNILMFGGSPFSGLKKIFIANIMDTVSATDSFMANLFPVQKRHKEDDAKIATRMYAFMESMKQIEVFEVGTGTLMMRKTAYLVLKSASKMLYALVMVPQRTAGIQAVLENRQYSYLMATPFTFDKLDIFFKLQEGRKHFFYPFKNLEDVYRRLRHIELQESSKSVATIYGALGSDKVLNIKTFNDVHYRLSVHSTQECSYLLAADVRQRRWSIVLTPDGLTFMAEPKTISLSWQKDVYLDNCKVPSIEVHTKNVNSYNTHLGSDYGSIKLSQTDSSTTIESPYGVTMICDNSDNVCSVIMDVSLRDETIGLLGNNDREPYTDKLLPDGHVASSAGVLSSYALTSSESCQLSSLAPDEDSYQMCYKKYRECTEMFSGFYKTQKDCLNHIGNRRRKICRIQRCQDIKVNPCYVFKALIAECDAKGLLTDKFNMHDYCPSPVPSRGLITTGSLDVVLVVSNHASMIENRYHPWHYLKQLGLSKTWRSFYNVRIGLVGFGGNKDKFNPHAVVQQSDNRYFSPWSTLHWNKIDEIDYGTVDADGFDAIKKAAEMPFRPTSHKMIILVMTQEQGSGQAADLAKLTSVLEDKGIILNVISDYPVFSSQRIVGLNHEGRVITKLPGYDGYKNFPEDDYATMVTKTNGALWNLDFVAECSSTKLDRIVDEFLTQSKSSNEQSCPAA